VSVAKTLTQRRCQFSESQIQNNNTKMKECSQTKRDNQISANAGEQFDGRCWDSLCRKPPVALEGHWSAVSLFVNRS